MIDGLPRKSTKHAGQMLSRAKSESINCPKGTPTSVPGVRPELVLSVLDVAIVLVLDEEVKSEMPRVLSVPRFADPAQIGAFEPVEAQRFKSFAFALSYARAKAPAVRQQRRQTICPRFPHQITRLTNVCIRRRGLEAARRWCCRHHQARRPPHRRRRIDRFRLEPLRQSIRGIIKCALHRGGLCRPSLPSIAIRHGKCAMLSAQCLRSAAMRRALRRASACVFAAVQLAPPATAASV